MENNPTYMYRSYEYLFVYYEQSQNKRRLKKEIINLTRNKFSQDKSRYGVNATEGNFMFNDCLIY